MRELSFIFIVVEALVRRAAVRFGLPAQATEKLVQAQVGQPAGLFSGWVVDYSTPFRRFPALRRRVSGAQKMHDSSQKSGV
jgi:hypothetical protein